MFLNFIKFKKLIINNFTFFLHLVKILRNYKVYFQHIITSIIINSDMFLQNYLVLLKPNYYSENNVANKLLLRLDIISSI